VNRPGLGPKTGKQARIGPAIRRAGSAADPAPPFPPTGRRGRVHGAARRVKFGEDRRRAAGLGEHNHEDKPRHYKQEGLFCFMPGDLNRWEKLKPLGEGGQGKVFLVRTPERVEARRQSQEQIRPCIGGIGGHDDVPSETVVQKLLKAIEEYNRGDSPNELGALKEFMIPSDNPAEAAQARQTGIRNTCSPNSLMQNQT